MKLVPYDKTKLGGSFYKRTNNLKILEEFVDSDYDCVEVREYNHSKPAHCSSSLANTIKRFKMNNLRAILRDGHVYLIKI